MTGADEDQDQNMSDYEFETESQPGVYEQPVDSDVGGGVLESHMSDNLSQTYYNIEPIYYNEDGLISFSQFKYGDWEEVEAKLGLGLLEEYVPEPRLEWSRPSPLVYPPGYRPPTEYYNDDNEEDDEDFEDGHIHDLVDALDHIVLTKTTSDGNNQEILQYLDLCTYKRSQEWTRKANQEDSNPSSESDSAP